MAKVLPFQALRPATDYAKDVAALPYDVYSREEAKEAVKGKPLSFLNIDRPETQFEDGHDMYGDDVYKKADEMIQSFKEKGIFIKDERKHYYIYELTMNGRAQNGIVALSSIDDYINGVCKKHENTVAEKEVDRINHVDVTSAQTGPIFLAYRQKQEISDLVEKVKKEAPLYDFVAEDGVKHTVWIVDDCYNETLIKAFENVEATYIADGHHRTASAVKVGLKRREEHPDYTGEEEFNYFLSVLFPDNELYIMDYNRFVKDLNGLSEKEFFGGLLNVFNVSSSEFGAPERKGIVKMYYAHQWYTLTMKEECLEDRNDPVTSLDVAYLQDLVLTPILGIEDPRVDKRISFIGGIRGLKELERLVDEKEGSVAFAMYPTSIDELLAVADAKMLMPPKSTWFEPKLRSGLFIHEIER